MVDAIKMRGGEKMREMVEAMEQNLADVQAQRSAAMSTRAAFVAAPVMAAEAGAEPRQEIYDGQQRAALPGQLVRTNDDEPSSDTDVNQAYDAAIDTYKLYREVYGRDSVDGHGLTLISTVHHQRNFNNAFWNGQQMAYGDGDGVLFKSLTGSLSVIGHELSHGVVEFSGGLVYRDQSGALNESFADVFGALVTQYKLGQSAAEADWLIGDGILGPDINGVALRSLKEPGLAYDDAMLGRDPQPYHMDFYINTQSDNGGVHLNSGIPNHAFYLLAQLLGGNAWEKPGQIWYNTMQEINNMFATFNDWADKSVEVARDLHGSGSLEAILTRRAWRLVGIDV
jgi:Zn-dependent metalloprotease